MDVDVLGVDCAAFDCHVLFSDDGGCSSCGNPASFCFFGDGFRMVFPSGAAQADIDSYGIVFINGFVCFLIFLYVSCVHSCLHSIQGFQPVYYLFSNSKVIPSSFLSSISNPFSLSIYSFINFLSEA